MTIKNKYKFGLLGLIALSMLLLIPPAIDAQEPEPAKLTRAVSEQEFRDAQNEILDLRSSQQKIVRSDNPSSLDNQQELQRLDQEISLLMPIIEKYREQKFNERYIEPERKAELEFVEKDLRQKFAELGLETYAVNLNTKTKTIQVVTADATKNSEVESLMDSYGSNIPFEFGNSDIVMFDEACANQTDDCDPIVGGIKITGEGDGPCTLALPVRDGTWPFYNYYFATAGHCIDDNDDMGQPLDIAADKIGDGTDSENEPDCDCALTDKTAGNAPGSDVWRSSNNYLVVTTESSSRPSDGTSLTMSGQASGFLFGEVEDGNFTWTVGSTTYDFIETDFSTTGGDSGAPVGDADFSDIIGIHKGKVEIMGVNHTIASGWDEFDADYSVDLY